MGYVDIRIRNSHKVLSRNGRLNLRVWSFVFRVKNFLFNGKGMYNMLKNLFKNKKKTESTQEMLDRLVKEVDQTTENLLMYNRELLMRAKQD